MELPNLTSGRRFACTSCPAVFKSAVADKEGFIVCPISPAAKAFGVSSS